MSARGGMSTDAQKKASAKYDAKNTVKLTLKLNRKTDNDIIAKIDKQKNKSAYIKDAIRKQNS